MLRLLLVFIIATFELTAQTELKVTYVGNMGVLIEGKTQSVLIDGLHKKYKPAYQFPPEALIHELLNNERKSPVTLVLNTHIHKDHFDAELNLQFLKSNHKAIFIGTQQAEEELKVLRDFEFIRDQVESLSLERFTLTVLEHQGVNITAISLDHVNPGRHSDTDNIGYLIEMDGKKIFHAGDADINESLFNTLSLETEEIDVAILPNWLAMSQDGVKIVREFIQPKKIILTHISPDYAEFTKKEAGENFPDAILFTTIRQDFIF